MGAQQRAQCNIGDFDLSDGRRYRVYADPDWALADDSVTVSRVHPDPARGRAVATAKGLDSPTPVFHFPSDWSETDQATASREIVRLWRTDWRLPLVDFPRAVVQQIYIGHRRLRLLLEPGVRVVSAELLHDDDRPPTWAGTFYHFERGLDHRECWPLMRSNWRFANWLGRKDGDRVGAQARERLRAAAWGLWTFRLE